MRVNLKNNKGNVPSIERRRRHHHLVCFRAGASARSARCARPRRRSAATTGSRVVRFRVRAPPRKTSVLQTM